MTRRSISAAVPAEAAERLSDTRSLPITRAHLEQAREEMIERLMDGKQVARCDFTGLLVAEIDESQGTIEQVGWALLGTWAGKRYVSELRRVDEGQNERYHHPIFALSDRGCPRAIVAELAAHLLRIVGDTSDEHSHVENRAELRAWMQGIVEKFVASREDLVLQRGEEISANEARGF